MQTTIQPTLEGPDPDGRKASIETREIEGIESIEISFPFHPPEEVLEMLQKEGFSETKGEIQGRWFTKWSKENFEAAYRIKTAFDGLSKPTIPPELLEVVDFDDRVASDPRKEAQRTGVDLFDIITKDDTGSTTDILIERLGEFLEEAGVYEIFPIPNSESDYQQDTRWAHRKMPWRLDEVGQVISDEYASITLEKAQSILFQYLPLDVSIEDISRKILEGVVKGVKVVPTDVYQFPEDLIRSVELTLWKAGADSSKDFINLLLDKHNRYRELVPEDFTSGIELEMLESALKYNGKKVALQLVDQWLGDIHSKSESFRKLSPPILKALRYLEGRFLALFNGSRHRALSTLVQFKIPVQKVREIRKLIEGHREGESLGFIIAPPKVKGEYHKVSYRGDQEPPVSSDFFEFDEGWEKLWGRPAKGFSSLVFGPPKHGKSTVVLDFAGYLARKGFGPVLYCSFEEADNPTLAERRKRLGATSSLLKIKNYLPTDLSPYKVVVLDSISKADADIEIIETLLEEYPGITFLFIAQVTKQGKARGSNKIAHEVDTLVEVLDGMAIASSRFGPGEKAIRFK